MLQPWRADFQLADGNPSDLTTVLPAVGDTPALAVWLFIAVVNPFLVDLITNRLASPRLKASLLLVLSIVTGVVSGFLNAHNAGLDYDWKSALWGAALTWFLSDKVFRFGKNADIFGQNGVVAKAIPGGLGKPVIYDTSQTVLVEGVPDVTDPIEGGPGIPVPDAPLAKGPETRLL